MITLFSYIEGANGWVGLSLWLINAQSSPLTLNDFFSQKVAVVLEELGLEYRTQYLDLKGGEHKKEEFTKYNPNAREWQRS